MDYQKKIAKFGLEIGAIKLRPSDPFKWASGYFMPIYNDNRMFLWYSEYRRLFAEGFAKIGKDENIDCDIIAGTSTAGVSPCVTLSDLLMKPLVYVRNNPNTHGMEKQMEGMNVKPSGKKVLLIEDLISTGGSSIAAVNAVRAEGADCNYCFSIFNYGLEKAESAFQNLEPLCQTRSLLTYKILLDAAKEENYFNKKEFELLEEWESDPFGWGKKHFPQKYNN